MTRARDLLQRFRPAGAPGAASATGVPADRRADLAAELQPLFDQLAPTERECMEILEQARATADRLRTQAAERAQALVHSAEQRAKSERATALVTVRARVSAESAAAWAAAEREAADVRMRADERSQDYVDTVIASVGQLLSGVAQERPTSVGYRGSVRPS